MLGSLLLSSLAAAGSARADTFAATRDKALVEKSHRVKVTLRRDHAELKVTRSVWNGADKSDQAVFDIHTDSEAVAIGLRTQAVVDGKPVWFQGELLEAEAAAKKYRELTGIGGFYPKDPALLSWRRAGHLKLQVFPCLPKEEKTVEYTLIAPMHYRDGGYEISLPAMGTEKLPATATFSADGGKLLVDGKAPPSSAELKSERALRQTVTFSQPVEGALAAVPVGQDKALFSYHLDITPRLAEVPDKARIVILLDASHSFGKDELAAARAAADAYLGHFTGSDVGVQLYAFGRTVEALTSGFESPSQVRKLLTDKSISLRNGSELGKALEQASQALLSAPAGAERRVLLFTDLATKRALTPASLKTLLPQQATLHVVTIDSTSQNRAQRDDEDSWAKLPRATGGLLYRVSATTATADKSARSKAFEELARPLRLDHVELAVAGLDDVDAPESLAEGEGLEDHRVVDKLVSHVVLKAELWSKPVVRTLEPDEAYGRRRAALAIGSSLIDGMSEAELMRVALHGRAVSPVTSYLAIEPGVRPSTEGLDWGHMWGDQIGDAFGAGGFGLSGIGEGGGGAVDHTNYEALLAGLAKPALGACSISAGSAKLSIESTHDEIVEVTTTVAQDDKQRTQGVCLAEHVWAAKLPAAFGRFAHKATTTKL